MDKCERDRISYEAQQQAERMRKAIDFILKYGGGSQSIEQKYRRRLGESPLKRLYAKFCEMQEFQPDAVAEYQLMSLPLFLQPQGFIHGPVQRTEEEANAEAQGNDATNTIRGTDGGAGPSGEPDRPQSDG